MSNTLAPIIQQIKDLSLEQRNTLYRQLEQIKTIDDDELHSIISICESHSYQQKCVHCQSSKFKKHGRYKDRQRYKCKTCNRTFNELTGTAWHYIHDKDKFRQYISYLAEQKTLLECTIGLKICMQTAFCWRHKLLRAFEIADLKPLKNHIQADETSILESCKGNPVGVAKNQRAARKRGGKSKHGGFSLDQMTILAACDADKNAVLRYVGNGGIKKASIYRALGSLIRKQRVNKAIFVTDANNSFLQFARDKRMIHQIVPSTAKSFKNAQGFHLQSVNAIHSRLKRWLNKFNGVATKYIQNYLNCFRLWDKFTNFKDRFIYFFRMSVADKSAFIRNQDVNPGY